MIKGALPVLALVLPAMLALPATGQTITFGDAKSGLLPVAFEMGRTGRGGAATWSVVDDATAEGGRALAQTSTDKTDYRFLLAIYRPFSARDVQITVHFKPVAGQVDQAGGVVVRLASVDDYYVARANALEDNVRLYRVVKGKREEIRGADIKVAPNAWHTLTLRAAGDLFTVGYDGQILFTATDKTFSNAGKVGLWTKADSVTHFDRMEIHGLDDEGKGR